MKNRKRTYIIMGLMLALLIGALGVTYAKLREVYLGSENQKLIVGDIYLHYTENNTITFNEGASRATYDPTKYFEFTISGKNTYTEEDIVYDVVLNYGDDHETRTTRLRDDLLRFRLVELVENPSTHVVEEQVIFDDRSYVSIDNMRIYKATIPAETNNQVDHTYRLYAWITNLVVLGNKDTADYDFSTWSDVYASIRVDVTGDFVDKMVGQPIYDIVKTGAASDSGIRFYEVNGTDNGNGKFVRSTTTNTQYPIYYYRGNVLENNVIFAEKCWKIVRTTETGGTKLIYNGEISNDGECNNTNANTQLPSTSSWAVDGLSLSYVGYNYGVNYPITDQALSGTYINTVSWNGTRYIYSTENGNTSNSINATHHYICENENCTSLRYYYYYSTSYAYYITLTGGKTIENVLDEMLFASTDTNKILIHGVIDDWYDANIKTNYENYLEDTTFCADRSVSLQNRGAWNPNGGSAMNDILKFDALKRIEDKNENNPPTLTCSNPNDRMSVGNGKLDNPVALLTSDEAALAGLEWNVNNSNNYLYTGNYYWLLTPSSMNNSSARQANVTNAGKLYRGNIDSAAGVRPVISLKHGVLVFSGQGTASNPYIAGTLRPNS